MIRYLALALLFAGPAYADCGPFDQIAEQLSEKFGEQLAFGGMNNQGAYTLLYINPDTGTWTAVWVQPSGEACLVDAGESGELIEVHPGVTG